MDDKAILGLFRNIQNNADFDANPLNKREIPSMLQKNKRRSKKDKTGRNYICGCGKNYLSYPALYTHIKNKHEGKAPEGTTLQPATRVKPGRPPKRPDSPSRRSDGEGSGNEDDGDQSVRSSDKKSNMSNLDFTPTKTYEDKLRYSTLRKEMLTLEDLKLVSELNCQGNASPTKSFVKERNLITNQNIVHPLANIISVLANDATDETFFTQLTCDKIFSIFLYNLSKFSNQTFHSMVALLIRSLRLCLNDHGYDLLQLFEAQNPTQKIELLKESTDSLEGTSFCMVEPAWYITIVFDFFVKEYLPRYLDSTDFNLAFVCSFLQALNDWLLKNNLSKIKCTFFSFYK